MWFKRGRDKQEIEKGYVLKEPVCYLGSCGGCTVEGRVRWFILEEHILNVWRLDWRGESSCSRQHGYGSDCLSHSGANGDGENWRELRGIRLEPCPRSWRAEQDLNPAVTAIRLLVFLGVQKLLLSLCKMNRELCGSRFENTSPISWKESAFCAVMEPLQDAEWCVRHLGGRNKIQPL